MSSENYRLTDDQLILQDSEMGLDLTLPFRLPRLPQDLSLPKILETGELLVIERDPPGDLRAAYLTRNGKRHGQCRLYYSEQVPQAEMFYQEGHLHGPSLFFSEEGHLLSRTFFCEGKREGKAFLYYPSEKVASIQRFKQGVWEGLQEYFYESGKIKSLVPYLEGKLEGEVKLFFEDGSLKRSVCYRRGKREGKDQIYHAQRGLTDEGEYEEGLPKGIHRHFFRTGHLKEEIVYHTPYRCDYKEWNQEGKLVKEGIWSADLTYAEKVYLEKGGARVRRGYWDGSRLCWK